MWVKELFSIITSNEKRNEWVAWFSLIKSLIQVLVCWMEKYRDCSLWILYHRLASFFHISQIWFKKRKKRMEPGEGVREGEGKWAKEEEGYLNHIITDNNCE